MFGRDDFRFDLFTERVFRTQLSESMKKEKYALHEFVGKKTLRMHVLRTEHVVLLKAVTERENDFADIINIITTDKHFDWKLLIEEAAWQHHHGDGWALLDLEETMKKLKGHVFVPQQYFEMLYAAAEKK